MTDDELARRKEELVGSFKVSLATTDGMAASLLTTVQRGYDLNWLDVYPQKIGTLTTAQVNAAIRKYVRPGQLYIIKAGAVPGAHAAP